jgi:N-acetylglucosamine kinase-like BadF-type ATPase
VDDVGSAYWTVVEALKAAVRQYDGRMPATALLPAMFNALGIEEAGDFFQRVYGPAATRAEIAALCPAVMRLWNDGDPVAAGIIHEGIKQLALMVTACGRKLGLAAPRIVVSGGLWTGEEAFRTLLGSELARLVPAARIQPAILTPVQGGVIEARRLLDRDGEAAFIDHLAGDI